MKRRPAQAGKFDAVPMLDLSRQYQQIREEILRAVERVCASQHFILGEEVAALEKEIAAFTDAGMLLHVRRGLMLFGWLCWRLEFNLGMRLSLPHSVFLLLPVRSSVSGLGQFLWILIPRAFNLEPADLASKLKAHGSRVRAILPVHLYGQCADMDAIGALASEFEIPVVEDAAQAIGAAWKKQRAGSLGLAAAFSFYPTKNLSAYGDAGLVTTRNPEWAERMRRLRNHGSPQRYLHRNWDGIAAWMQCRRQFCG